MRPYDQYCALARALDVVGDRWTLLIVRELLFQPCRYVELQGGLEGIATNLLTARLRTLEEGGIATRDEEGRYILTGRGQSLAAPIAELVRWGALLMREIEDSDSFRSRWLKLPFDLIFAGVDSSRPDLEIEIRTGDETITMSASEGIVRTRTGPAAAPDLVVSGPPDAIIGLFSGREGPDLATERGVHILGDFGIVDQLRSPGWLTAPTLLPSSTEAGGGNGTA